MSIRDYIIKEKYSWDMLVQDIETLANIILKSYKPDVVICISTGGWIPGRLLKNHIPAIYYSIGCLAYGEDGNFSGKIQLIQKFGDDLSLVGKKILILDEVCETGKTLQVISEYIRDFNPLSIKTSVIHQKEHSDVKADFYLYSVKEKWIIYPWSLV